MIVIRICMALLYCLSYTMTLWTLRPFASGAVDRERQRLAIRRNHARVGLHDLAGLLARALGLECVDALEREGVEVRGAEERDRIVLAVVLRRVPGAGRVARGVLALGSGLDAVARDLRT
jgi:hypothetical protein